MIAAIVILLMIGVACVAFELFLGSLAHSDEKDESEIEPAQSPATT